MRSANETRDVRMRVELDEPAKCVSAGGMGGGNFSQAQLVDVPPDPGHDDVSTRVDTGRRAYRLPSMADIERARGSTGLRVVSTFSGCGGSCLGLEMAGYDIRYANEFVESARDTYRLNHASHVHLDPRDIRTVKPEDILAQLGIAKGELDLFEGSPPCASFSTAGNRDKDWGKVKSYSDVKQRTDDLFFEWARVLDGLQPRAFVAENVSGLVKGKAFGYFRVILEKLEACGYVVGAKVLDAQWLGVPQTRTRLIFMGVRRDIAAQLGLTVATLPYPKPLRYFFSMRDALPHLRSVVHDTSGAWGSGEVIVRPSPAITVGVNSVNSYHFKVDGPVLDDDVRIDPTPGELVEAKSKVEGYAIERVYKTTEIGKWDRKYLQAQRAHPDLPALSITAIGGGAGVASALHPFERRKFTIRELRRLCAFPDDFKLVGSYAQQWERLGRSVPPRMMYHVGAALRDGVFAPLGLLREGWSEAP